MSKRDMIINPITGEIDLDLHKIVKGFSTGGQSLKDNLKIDAPQRTPNHPSSSHVVKTRVDGKDKMIRFGEQGASTAGKPKEGESDKMKAKRKSFKDRHAKNIAKGKSSAAYWADREKWAEGGEVETIQGGTADQWREYGESLAVDLGDVTWADVANTVVDFTPIIGDIKGGIEGAEIILEELKANNPNWLLIGAIGGASVLGVIPIVGDVAKKLIMKGANKFKKDDVLAETLNMLPEQDAAIVKDLTNRSASYKFGLTDTDQNRDIATAFEEMVEGNKDLYTEDVYHFTKGTTRSVGDDVITGGKFDPSRGTSRLNRLGTHVGTSKAANDRASFFLGPNNDSPTGGGVMPLRARLDKPFLDESGEVFQERDIVPLMNKYADDAQIADLDIAADMFRQELTDKGYTNIPYVNAIEDRGNISHIMLTDRTAGDPAVLKGKFGSFEDIYDPSLMKAEGGRIQYNPNNIKRNAAALLMEADNG
tara:strand:- start:18 stop:1457 length:1440 start_codon:yes stop_codon:yes gene_type:complete